MCVCFLHHYQSVAIPAITLLPQVAETNTPQPQDVAEEYFLYDGYVTRLYATNVNSEKYTDLKQKLTFLYTISRGILLIGLNRKENFEMATSPSRQIKKQDLVDPIVVLLFVTLLCALVAFGPLNGNMHSSAPNTLAMNGVSADNAFSGVGASFALDLQYWSANCNHGWTSDSACDTLVSRTQWCSLGVGSAYCLEYDAYLQRIRNQQNRISF